MRCFAFAECVYSSPQLFYKDFSFLSTVKFLVPLPQNTSITNSIAVFFRDISYRNQHIDVFFGIFLLCVLMFLFFFKKHRRHRKSATAEIIKLKTENEFLSRNADLRFSYQHSLMYSNLL